MTYKMLKKKQMDKLKEDGKFKELIAAISKANLTAFGDIRNILFDREIGTNILSEFLN